MERRVGRYHDSGGAAFRPESSIDHEGNRGNGGVGRGINGEDVQASGHIGAGAVGQKGDGECARDGSRPGRGMRRRVQPVHHVRLRARRVDERSVWRHANVPRAQADGRRCDDRVGGRIEDLNETRSSRRQSASGECRRSARPGTASPRALWTHRPTAPSSECCWLRGAHHRNGSGFSGHDVNARAVR